MIKAKDKKFTRTNLGNVDNKEFYRDEARTYGVDNFDEVISYASMYNLDLVTACRDFEFSDEFCMAT